MPNSEHYATGVDRTASGWRAVLRCKVCGGGWESPLSREEFSDVRLREQIADRWADIVSVDHDRAAHPERLPVA